jgi:hypothetical protein
MHSLISFIKINSEQILIKFGTFEQQILESSEVNVGTIIDASPQFVSDPMCSLSSS